MKSEDVTLKNLLMLRKNAGLTQQALADEFHLSQQTIYKYERGHAEPDIKTLKQFADFFGVTVDFLIGNEKPVEELQLDFTMGEKELITKIRKLTPEVKIALNAFINYLTENK